jgi:hypothetical protein
MPELDLLAEDRDHYHMFDVTLVDHLRLAFGHVGHSYQAHTELTNRLLRQSRWIQFGLVGVLTITAAAAVGATSRAADALRLIAATGACISLGLLVLQLSLNLEGTILAHRSAATRLWLIREKYRALLADLNDGHVDSGQIRARRDALTNELHAIYENVPPTDRDAFDRARKALAFAGAQALNDEEVDRFLPKSLRKTSGASIS